jgi:hypothetical protein
MMRLDRVRQRQLMRIAESRRLEDVQARDFEDLVRRMPLQEAAESATESAQLPTPSDEVADLMQGNGFARPMHLMLISGLDAPAAVAAADRALALGVDATPIEASIGASLAALFRQLVDPLRRLRATRGEPWRLVARIHDAIVPDAEAEFSFDGVVLSILLRTSSPSSRFLMSEHLPELNARLVGLGVACSGVKLELAELVSGSRR